MASNTTQKKDEVAVGLSCTIQHASFNTQLATFDEAMQTSPMMNSQGVQVDIESTRKQENIHHSHYSQDNLIQPKSYDKQGQVLDFANHADLLVRA